MSEKQHGIRFALVVAGGLQLATVAVVLDDRHLSKTAANAIGLVALVLPYANPRGEL